MKNETADNIPKMLGLNTETKRPYVFNKNLNKSLTAAEVVLGPVALRKLLVALAPDAAGQQDIFIGDILRFADPKRQLRISIPEPETGDVNITAEPKAEFIDAKYQAYALLDIKSVLAAAIRDDLTGFVMQALQYKWNRELTIDDAENISFHLNKLIHLLKEEK